MESLDNISSIDLLHLSNDLSNIAQKINDNLNISYFKNFKGLDFLFFERVLSNASQIEKDRIVSELNSGNASALTDLTLLISNQIDVQLENVKFGNNRRYTQKVSNINQLN